MKSGNDAHNESLFARSFKIVHNNDTYMASNRHGLYVSAVARTKGKTEAV